MTPSYFVFQSSVSRPKQSWSFGDKTLRFYLVKIMSYQTDMQTDKVICKGCFAKKMQLLYLHVESSTLYYFKCRLTQKCKSRKRICKTVIAKCTRIKCKKSPFWWHCPFKDTAMHMHLSKLDFEKDFCSRTSLSLFSSCMNV